MVKGLIATVISFRPLSSTSLSAKPTNPNTNTLEVSCIVILNLPFKSETTELAVPFSDMFAKGIPAPSAVATTLPVIVFCPKLYPVIKNSKTVIKLLLICIIWLFQGIFYAFVRYIVFAL
jgi:hypothetical protein